MKVKQSIAYKVVEPFFNRPKNVTHRLSAVTSLARWANKTGSTRSTRRSRGSSNTSLTAVSLFEEISGQTVKHS